MKKQIWPFYFIILVAFNCNIAPGSYVYAEEYTISTSEKKMIVAVDSFYANNPKYTVPIEVGLKNGKRDSLDYWYHIYFYLPNEDLIVKAWLREGYKETTMAFVGINTGLTLGNWRDINKDFTDEENARWKKRFETEFLEKIKNYL